MQKYASQKDEFHLACHFPWLAKGSYEVGTYVYDFLARKTAFETRPVVVYWGRENRSVMKRPRRQHSEMKITWELTVTGQCRAFRDRCFPEQPLVRRSGKIAPGAVLSASLRVRHCPEPVRDERSEIKAFYKKSSKTRFDPLPLTLDPSDAIIWSSDRGWPPPTQFFDLPTGLDPSDAIIWSSDRAWPSDAIIWSSDRGLTPSEAIFWSFEGGWPLPTWIWPSRCHLTMMNRKLPATKEIGNERQLIRPKGTVRKTPGQNAQTPPKAAIPAMSEKNQGEMSQ